MLCNVREYGPRVVRAELYQLSLVVACTVAESQYAPENNQTLS